GSLELASLGFLGPQQTNIYFGKKDEVGGIFKAEGTALQSAKRSWDQRTPSLLKLGKVGQQMAASSQ
ncbi:hypothetical protein LEMLEM_LOCUS14788, partial [Lemmus lemmus]